MKKNKNISKYSLGLLTGILGTSIFFSTLAFAGSSIKLIINGNEVACDSPPQMINGRVMVPARNVAENLGATVTWDAQSNSVLINSKNTATNTPTPKTEQTNKTNQTSTTPTVQRTTWNGMEAIIKDGQTYFLGSNYSDKASKSSKVKTSFNPQTNEITIQSNGVNTTITQSNDGWIIYENRTYINSKYYVEP